MLPKTDFYRRRALHPVKVQLLGLQTQYTGGLIAAVAYSVVDKFLNGTFSDIVVLNAPLENQVIQHLDARRSLPKEMYSACLRSYCGKVLVIAWLSKLAAITLQLLHSFNVHFFYIETLKMNRLLLVAISFSFILTSPCQTVDFTFISNNGSYCNPSTVIFKQACTGNPLGFLWDFGNNRHSDKPIDSTSYTDAGTYIVKLTAIFENTTLEVSKTIVINLTPAVGIGYDKNYICQPGTIKFKATGGAPGAKYDWNFGDKTTPVSTLSDTISHFFTKFGTDTVKLQTTSSSGCIGTASTIITVKSPSMSIQVSQVNGCVPATVNFTGTVALPVNSSVTSYTWNFKDGSRPVVSNGNTATHTYLSPGDYIPSLSIISTEGCTNTFNYDKLYFGIPPTNHIAFPKTNSVCGSDSAVFITKATNANRYFWTFGDGTSVSTKDTIIRHKYNTIGTKNVRVNAYYNECGTIGPSLRLQVSIVGVIAKYDWSNTCSNKSTYSFRDTSSGTPTSSLWIFGDGKQQANTTTAVHSFPVPGQFATTLSMHDAVSGCSDSISKIIYTAAPKLHTPDSSICRKDTVSVSILDNYTDTSARYTWSIAGSQAGPTKHDTTSIRANNFGSFNNFVVIDRGAQNCPDTIKSPKLFIVKGPVLNFTAPAGICLNTPLVIVNNSKAYIASDTIQHWYWNFTGSSINDSAFQPAPFKFKSAGTYTIKLKAIDKNGCEDTLTQSVVVNPVPYLHLNAPTTNSICAGQPVTMIAVHSNELLWSPATNVSCTTCDTVIVTPNVSTTYYATVTNSFNCIVQDSNHININVPFTATVAPPDVYLCLGETTNVDVNPKGKKILWSPAAGLSDPSVYNPVITATNSVTYIATLSDSTGCPNSSTTTLNVHLKSAPLVNAGPDKFYSKGTAFSLSPIYGSNIISYLWTPAALLSCSSCPEPNGVANSNQLFVIKVTSDSGCVASDSVFIGVDCNSNYIFMPKAFTPNNDNLNDVFYPMATGMKSIIRFAIYNRQGQAIFESRNFPPNTKQYGWDGKYKGIDQSAGGYIYTLETECEAGGKISKEGNVLLIR